MVIKTYFDKNNTLIYNSNVNTGLNPITELYYGGSQFGPQFTRFIFHFDETKIKNLYTDKTFADITKLKHTLRMTNTGFLDPSLLNTNMGIKERTSSFILALFTLNQHFDNGVGYDYTACGPHCDDNATGISVMPSNWFYAKTTEPWIDGNGTFTGATSGVTIATQSFDYGNENIEIDITDYVNGVITGNTNYGLGLAFDEVFEESISEYLKYVGFFTNRTQTFYEPYVETVYSNHITDDRNNFFLDKPNKLYLYVNVAGNPVNLDALPTVTIYDNTDMPISGYTSSEITHVTKGVYCIDINIPTGSSNIETMYSDVWSGISINGITRPNISLNFVVKDSFGYYNSGDSNPLPKKIAVNISGIRDMEIIKRGDVRKAIVSARIPYTIEQTQAVSSLKYRIYIKEGNAEITVIDFQPIELTNNYYYFLIDTPSLLPNTYYIDILAESNLEVTTLKEVNRFIIANQVELRANR